MKTSTLQIILEFFNSKKSNKIFTRAEYFMFMGKYAPRAQASYLDTTRCYLVNAGYLIDEEPGVYRKLKPIPKGLNSTQLKQEAYPKKTKKNPVNIKRAIHFSGIM